MPHSSTPPPASGTRSLLRAAHWPARAESVRRAGLVLGLLVLVGATIGGVDALSATLAQRLYG